MSLRSVSHWREGCRYKSKARFELGTRPNFRTDHADFQPKGPFGTANYQKQNSPHISIGFGGEGVSQSPLKDQAFSTFLDQNPPFELR
jgi:hypothetical protein